MNRCIKRQKKLNQNKQTATTTMAPFWHVIKMNQFQTDEVVHTWYYGACETAMPLGHLFRFVCVIYNIKRGSYQWNWFLWFWNAVCIMIFGQNSNFIDRYNSQKTKWLTCGSWNQNRILNCLWHTLYTYYGNGKLCFS